MRLDSCRKVKKWQQLGRYLNATFIFSCLYLDKQKHEEHFKNFLLEIKPKILFQNFVGI